MDSFEDRQKALDERKKRIAAENKQAVEEQAALNKERQQRERQKEIKSLKDRRAKLIAELEDRDSRIAKSQAMFRTEMEKAKAKLQMEHDSRVQGIRKANGDIRNNLLQVEKKIQDEESKLTTGSTSLITDKSTHGDNVLVAQPQGDRRGATAAHEVDADSDLDSLFLSDSEKAKNKTHQFIAPTVPKMLGSQNRSPDATAVKETAHTARAERPPIAVDTGKKLTPPGDNIVVGQHKQRKQLRNAPKGGAALRKLPPPAPGATNVFDMDDSEEEASAQETFLQRCSMICKHESGYYEIACPVLGCQQNASKQGGFFKGTAGLNKHIGSVHKDYPIPPKFEDCIVYAFDDVDCERLQAGQDPVSRKLPERMTGQTGGPPRRRSVTEATEYGPEVAAVPKRDAAKTTEKPKAAPSAPPPKPAPPTMTAAKASASKEDHGTKPPPKQVFRTPTKETTPARVPLSEKSSGGAAALTGGGKTVEDGTPGNASDVRRCGHTVASDSPKTKQTEGPLTPAMMVKGVNQIVPSTAMSTTLTPKASPSGINSVGKPAQSPPSGPGVMRRPAPNRNVFIPRKLTTPLAKSSPTLSNKVSSQAKGSPDNTPKGPSQQNLNGTSPFDRTPTRTSQGRLNDDLTPNRTPLEEHLTRNEAPSHIPSGPSQQLPRDRAPNERGLTPLQQYPRTGLRHGGERRHNRGTGDHYRPSTLPSVRSPGDDSEASRAQESGQPVRANENIQSRLRNAGGGYWRGGRGYDGLYGR